MADSLPSHSVFVRHVEQDLGGGTDEREYSKMDRENQENVAHAGLALHAPHAPAGGNVRSNPFDEEPLPRHSFSKQAAQVATSDRMSQARRSKDEGKKVVVKRPFLKRGSRKEPSALHRIKKDEHDSKHGLSGRNAQHGGSSSVGGSAMDGGTRRTSHSGPTRRGPQRPAQDVQVEVLVLEKPPSRAEPVSSPPDLDSRPQQTVALAEATHSATDMKVFEADQHLTELSWETEQSRTLKELEEFEALEQQLEAIEAHSGASVSAQPGVVQTFNNVTTLSPDNAAVRDDNYWGDDTEDVAQEAQFLPSVEEAIKARQQPSIVETVASRQYSEDVRGGPRRYVTARGTGNNVRGDFQRVDLENESAQAALAESTAATDRLRQDLTKKAEELEKELAAYKKENITIKQLRKQQETVLADAMKERKQIMNWIEEEKTQTELWCKEQKAAAVRQRRNASGMFRDAKQQKDADNVVPNRRERAEIQALQVTVEKLKVDYDALKKKTGVNERRMQTRIRDQTDTIKLQKDQIQALEDEKLNMWETLNKSTGGRNILKTLKNPPAGFSGSSRKRTTLKASSAEEYYFLSEMESAASAGETPAAVLYMGEDAGGCGVAEQESSYSRGSLSDAIFDSKTNLLMRKGARMSDALSTSRSSLRYHSSSQEYSDDEDVSPPQCMNENRHANSVQSRHADSELADEGGIRPSAPPTSVDSRKRTEVVTEDGRRIVTYRNQTVKETLPDGRSVVKYTNGDTMTTDPLSETVVYFYAQAGTTHTTLPDGTNVYEFPNEQIEEHYPDGTKHIYFPDSTKKVVYPDGTTESVFPDGVCVREGGEGEREIIHC